MYRNPHQFPENNLPRAEDYACAATSIPPWWCLADDGKIDCVRAKNNLPHCPLPHSARHRGTTEGAFLTMMPTDMPIVHAADPEVEAQTYLHLQSLCETPEMDVDAVTLVENVLNLIEKQTELRLCTACCRSASRLEWLNASDRELLRVYSSGA